MIGIYVLSPSQLQQSHVLCDEAYKLIDAIVVARRLRPPSRCGRASPDSPGRELVARSFARNAPSRAVKELSPDTSVSGLCAPAHQNFRPTADLMLHGRIGWPRSSSISLLRADTMPCWRLDFGLLVDEDVRDTTLSAQRARYR